jgi:hypothetical protein
MSTEVVKAETFGIEESKANEMTSGLDTILSEREILKEAFLDVMKLEVTPETIVVFKELRLKVVKNRTQGIEKWRKNTKAFFLAGGRFVDAKGNMESSINQDWEAKLLEAEKRFENIELAKIEALRVKRVAELLKYGIETPDATVGTMDESVYTNYISGVKLNYEKVKADELKAEQERIAQETKEAEEREAQRLENIKLKEEAEASKNKIEADKAERERLAAIEADKQAAIQAKIKAEADAKLKKENEAREKAEAKADQLIKENEAREEAARVETERLADEEKARIEAEQDAKKAADQAPDKEKLKAAIELVRESFEPVNVENSEVKAVAKEIEAKLIGWYNWANKEINNLK